MVASSSFWTFAAHFVMPWDDSHVVFVCRLIFVSKEGEFASLSQGGEETVFVKSKEDQESRRQSR